MHIPFNSGVDNENYLMNFRENSIAVGNLTNSFVKVILFLILVKIQFQISLKGYSPKIYNGIRHASDSFMHLSRIWIQCYVFRKDETRRRERMMNRSRSTRLSIWTTSNCPRPWSDSDSLPLGQSTAHSCQFLPNRRQHFYDIPLILDVDSVDSLAS